VRRYGAEIKPRLMIGWTYALYPLGLLLYSTTGSSGLVILGGVLLGVGSAFFWLVQGAMMIS